MKASSASTEYAREMSLRMSLVELAVMSGGASYDLIDPLGCPGRCLSCGAPALPASAVDYPLLCRAGVRGHRRDRGARGPRRADSRRRGLARPRPVFQGPGRGGLDPGPPAAGP